MSQARAVPRAVPDVDSGGSDGSAARWPAGGAGVVGSSGSDGAVASGVGVTELGEGLA